MLLPTSTDAPVHYFPFATIGLIAANVGVFVAMSTGGIDPVDGWLLVHGDGLRPREWLLSTFAHAGVVHLIGNMLFLWVFGLVVEGKLGWLRFLACYMAIGGTQSGIEQVMMLGSDFGVSLGASSAVYGIMAMAAVWAPKNEVEFFWWIMGPYSLTFNVPIGLLCCFYVGCDLLWVLVSFGAMGTSLLHVMGALLGAPLAVLLLKRGVVDCEGWDAFHVCRGDAGGRKAKEREDAHRAKTRQEKSKQRATERAAAAKTQLHVYLEAGNGDAALALVDKLRSAGMEFEPETGDLLKLAAALNRQKRWSESAAIMAEYIRRAPERADPVRVRLAQVCVVALERPGRALELIAATDTALLAADHQKLATKIARRAHQMQAQGVVELDDNAW